MAVEFTPSGLQSIAPSVSQQRALESVGLQQRIDTRQSTAFGNAGAGGQSAEKRIELEKLQRAEQERKLIEKMRESGRKRLTKSEMLVRSLTAREKIRREAQERGRGFTKTELQKRLKQMGTSVTELRRASASARRQYQRTGVSVTEQIRGEERKIREVKPRTRTVEEIKNIYFKAKDTRQSIAPSLKEEKRTNGIKKSLSIFKKPETYTTPAGVKSIFDFGAELTLRTGEFLAEKVKPVVDVLEGDIGLKKQLYKPAPIKRETAKEIISTAYMFSGFEPLMRTGTVQQMESAYIYDYQTGKWVKKSDLKRYLEQPVKTGKTVKYDLTYSEKASRINELLRRATTQEQKRVILQQAKQSYGANFIKDFTQQEGISSVATTAVKSTDDIFLGTSGVELKGISAVETGVSIKPSKVGETQWVKDSMMDVQDTKTKQDTKVKQLFLQDVKTRQVQKSRQDQLTRQDTKQDTLLKSLTTLIQKQKQLQRPELKLKTGQEFFRGGQPPKKPTKVTPPIIFPKESLVKRLAKKAEEGELFEVFITKKGGEVSIGEFRTKEQAKRGLLSQLAGTLSASGFVKKGGRKLKTRELGALGSAFRPSKVSMFKVVERKRRRLRKGGTGKQIQFFR